MVVVLAGEGAKSILFSKLSGGTMFVVLLPADASATAEASRVSHMLRVCVVCCDVMICFVISSV